MFFPHQNTCLHRHTGVMNSESVGMQIIFIPIKMKNALRFSVNLSCSKSIINNRPVLLSAGAELMM